MALPGHGSHVRDMLTYGWHDWANAVDAELRALKQRCDVVFIVGHLLGGSLWLHLPPAHEEVAGIVTLCAPIRMFPFTHMAVNFTKWIMPLVPLAREDVREPIARKRYSREAYRWTAMRPVESCCNSADASL